MVLANLSKARHGMLTTALLTILLVGCDSSSPTGGAAALTQLMLFPENPQAPPGGSVQFRVEGVLTDGNISVDLPVRYSATGGTVTATGEFIAPSAGGNYLVIATDPASSLSDTSTVSVTSTPITAPVPPPTQPSGNFTPIAGDDWKVYQSKQQLRAKDYFWWWLSGDVYQNVDLVPDPLYGQVVRVTFPQNPEVGFAPKLRSMFNRNLDDMWLRFKMKWSPGWTSAGPNPAGYANSYKLAFWYWESGYEGRGQIELSNTDEYLAGSSARDRSGQWLRHNETLLPGSATHFGRITTEWDDNQWWEYVVHYRRMSNNSFRQQFWRRRLTAGGQVAPGPWTYVGWELSGAYAPQASGIALGETKNKSNPTTMHIDWGPWEVVDGSQYPNPFAMPNAQ